MASRLIEILVQEKILREEQVDSALDYHQKNEIPLASALTALRFISEEELAQVLSRKLGFPCIDLDQFEIYPDVLALIPCKTALKYRMIPFYRRGPNLTVAMVDPTDLETVEEMRFLTGLTIQPVIAKESSIVKAINRYYSSYQVKALQEIEIIDKDNGDIEDIIIAEKDTLSLDDIKKLIGKGKEDFLGKALLAEMPMPITDHVNFSVTGTSLVVPGKSYLLDVWAHLDDQRQEVIRRAKEAYQEGDTRIETKGPVRVARGAILTVNLRIPDFIVKQAEDTILWVGQIGNARFRIGVPENAGLGRHEGTITVSLDGIQIAVLRFDLEVGLEESRVGQLQARERRVRSAFASYASEDRDRVAARLQGMRKALPELDLFWDVVSLRSGEFWRKRLKDEIARRDIFYLFWSIAASRSKWVKTEWNTALEIRGIEFIDPVPLDPPDLAPPPKKLAQLHFNAWELAYTRM